MEQQKKVYEKPELIELGEFANVTHGPWIGDLLDLSAYFPVF